VKARIVTGFMALVLCTCLSACGKESATSSVPDTSVDQNTTTTLASNPDDAVADARTQLANVNANLNDANSSLMTAQQDAENGEGDVQ
jgi:hypothetical protein